MPGQRVHASVCFIGGDYKPKATFHPDFGDIEWKRIVGVGKLDTVAWAEGIKGILEMDLFDIPGIFHLIQNYSEGRELDPKEWGERLEFMTSIRTSTPLTQIRDLTSLL